MLQRTLAVCVFSLFILGTVSESHAGGFLQRLRGNACSGRLVKWNRHCAVPRNECRPIQQACAPATVAVDCDVEYQKNCATCERVYGNDPTGKDRCLKIAKDLYEYCQGFRSVSFLPSAEESSIIPPFCICWYPEDCNGQTCLEMYDNTSHVFPYCDAYCYFRCLNKIPNYQLSPCKTCR
jgi:hypothetical protein